MLFSSLTFLFYFLPAVLVGYYLFRGAWRNYFLLLASLFFYAWGEPKFVLVMFGSIAFNYFMALVISANKTTEQKNSSGGGRRHFALIVAITGNLLILFVFKYLDFMISNINNLFNVDLHLTGVKLPIGISFFTFQAMSYVIDVYWGKIKVQKNFFYLGLYISFFPQLIAGPIVRYIDIEEQINERSVTWCDFAAGLEIFIIGLAKKVLIANNMAIVADAVWQSLGSGNESIVQCWIGSIAYSFQIFFDFSGYSDMAIGLGALFGFKFPQNFNYPYLAKSITDFWRRWHISLSSWFRDYVYIPLGGNRNGKKKQILNLFVVWLLTGIWHGAAWTFVFWGLIYFVFLVIEKLFNLDSIQNKFFSVSYRVFTLLIVNFCWIIFRSPDMNIAWLYIKSMFGLSHVPIYTARTGQYIFEYIFFYIFAFAYSVGAFKYIDNKLSSNTGIIVKRCLLFVLGAYSISFLIMGAHNPFIYFHF